MWQGDPRSLCKPAANKKESVIPISIRVLAALVVASSCVCCCSICDLLM